MTPPAQKAANGPEESAHSGVRIEASTCVTERGTTIDNDIALSPSKSLYTSPHEIRKVYGLDDTWQTVRTSLLRKSAGGNPISDDLSALVQTVFNPLAQDIESKLLACHNRYVESDMEIEKWGPQMGKYMTQLVNKAIDQAWSSLKTAMSEPHRRQALGAQGVADRSPPDYVEYEVPVGGTSYEEEGEDMVPVPPNNMGSFNEEMGHKKKLGWQPLPQWPSNGDVHGATVP